MLGKRDSPDGYGEAKRTTSALLTSIVAARECGVLTVVATNYPELVDAAATRSGRIDLKVLIPNPDIVARGYLITDAFQRSAPTGLALDPAVVSFLVAHWAGLSAAAIQITVARVGDRLKSVAGGTLPTVDMFLQSLKESQGVERGYDPDSTLGLDEVMLEDAAREALARAQHAMSDAFNYEQRGGSLPKGMLFFGPPGTGKTVTAKALAKSTGWSFIATSGTELARHPEQIDTLFARAIGKKPCVLFIDEANALLDHRDGNPYRAATEKFLSLTGSDSAELRDVLLIAATNNPEMADAAMARSGRLEQHIHFAPPSVDSVHRYLLKTLAKQALKHQLDEPETLALAARFAGGSLANVDQAVRDAGNRRAATQMSRPLSEASGIRYEDFAS